jgi:hypothetical protein
VAAYGQQSCHRRGRSQLITEAAKCRAQVALLSKERAKAFSQTPPRAAHPTDCSDEGCKVFGLVEAIGYSAKPLWVGFPRKALSESRWRITHARKDRFDSGFEQRCAAVGQACCYEANDLDVGWLCESARKLERIEFKARRGRIEIRERA